MKIYPEHEKQRKILNDAQAIGKFIDWLHQKGMCIAKEDGFHSEENSPWSFLVRYKYSINQILAEHFKIDLNKIEEEKEDMLNEFRKINNKQS